MPDRPNAVNSSRTRKRRALLVSLLAGTLLALLVLVAPANAQTLNGAKVSADDANPAVGTPVTFTATVAADCTPTGYTFSVDGAAQPKQTSNRFQATFSTTGSHTVSVSIEVCGGPYNGSTTVTVGPAPSGTISVSPDPPSPGASATLSVAPSGGRAPYSGYRWTIDGAADPAGNDKRSYTRTFANAGSHTVEVTFYDTGNPDPAANAPAHQGRATRTISVEEPAPPPPGSPPPPPPPPPPPCLKELHFALSQFRTDGCFQKISADGSSPDQWSTTDQVRLNGVSFADNGQRFVITGPTSAEPGGHIKTDDSAIQIDRFVPFSGSVDWSLPDGKRPDGTQGTVGTLREVAVPAFTRLFKLRVAGSIAIALSVVDDKYSARFPLNVELPPVFTAGPSKFAGGVSGAASITVDDDGPHYGGLKIAVTDVWVGQLKIKSACFSYLAAGEQSVEACKPPPGIDGTSIECATNVNTDRFDGSAVVQLPTAGNGTSKTTLSAFGGLADGSVSKLGGLAENLGTAVPIVPGVFLNKVGIGLCISPPPFKLRGDVGINALGGQLIVNGRITYTDATDSTPWRVDAGGNVTFKDVLLGDASVGFNAWGDVDFNINAGIDIKDVASVTGNINGWIEPRNSAFNLQGTVQTCIHGLPCGTASGLVSNVGLAGCFDLGNITVPLPDQVEWNKPSFGFVTITTRNETYHLQAGAGYKWGSTVDLLGNSCDFTPYAGVRSASARAAGQGLSERIRPGTRAVSLRIHGSNGPPKVLVRGPGGTRIESPATEPGLQRKGRFTLVENPTNDTTSVVIVKPAAGRWTVEAVPGARSTPTRLERSNFQSPPVLFGQQRQTRAGREVEVAYSVPNGASVQLVERGKGVTRTLARSLRGKRCRGTGRLPDGRTIRCVRVRFRPSRGPGGARRVEALVSRGGIPLARKALVRFRAPRPALPTRPRKLSARRLNGSLVVSFPRSRDASRYTATAVLSDGRKLGFDLSARCRAVRIPEVAKDVRVTVKVAGVRYDLAVGKYRRVVVPALQTAVGLSRKLPKGICS